jgi:SAM-dependent methyltransferase
MVKDNISVTNGRLEPVCSFCGDMLSVKFAGDIEKNGKRYSVYVCKKCSIGVLSPMPSTEELTKLYSPESYRAVSGVRFNKYFEKLIYMFRMRRKRRIKRYIGKGRILDIGCGRGLFLDIMRKDGWDVTGVEFNEEIASNASNAYGIDVKTGSPPDWGLADESLDVITINHVIEHIRNPVEIFNACKRLLKKGGLLVIAAPNISSLQAAAGKRVWFHLDVPYHLYHFSEGGLVRLLQTRSFHIKGIRRFDLEQGSFGCLQTLFNLSGIEENFFYNLLKSPEFRKRGSRKTLLLTLVLLPLYVPLAFMLSVIESGMLKRGGSVEIYAIKP